MERCYMPKNVKADTIKRQFSDLEVQFGSETVGAERPLHSLEDLATRRGSRCRPQNVYGGSQLFITRVPDLCGHVYICCAQAQIQAHKLK